MSLDRDLVVAALPAYDVGEELGRGAWGVVVAGTHRQLGREVAIKQLPRAFGNDPSVKRRFLEEARLLASFDHPHIVPLFDFVEHDGVCVFVMERLTGGTVWSRFQEGRLSPEAACAVVVAACAGLAYAHRRGVLHRDVKQENLMFSRDGVVKVTDFGIAKVVGSAQTMGTRAGFVLGTPAYIAPEQAEGGEIGPATDVYAAGTVLYELLSGELPFPDSSDPVAALYQRVHTEPRLLRDVAPGVPEPLADVTQKAIARAVPERYADAEQFGGALASVAAGLWGAAWIEASGIAVHKAAPVIETVPASAPTPPPPPAPAGPARRPRWQPLAAIAAVAAAIVVAIVIATGGGDGKSASEILPAPGPGILTQTKVGYGAVHCRGDKAFITCSNGHQTMTLGENGEAAQVNRATSISGGPEMEQDMQWTNGVVTCFAQKANGLSCATGAGDGFYMNAASSNPYINSH